ncbi:Lectin receptor kinase [Quillaja saponaria]|uniref:Lectin receptor kinase n=1 Tax=Quillaja saponaria TaxID=32244 RepID=A0AAD7KQB8_QUISA|nr:Lectin receptor kinase [Quillaja saponaria]
MLVFEQKTRKKCDFGKFKVGITRKQKAIRKNIQHRPMQQLTLEISSLKNYLVSWLKQTTLILGLSNQPDAPIDHSVGRASYKERIHLWSSKTGKFGDFTTKFSFTVKSVNSSVLFGDGFAFFIAPFESYIPHNSTGGLLGLFSPETALDISKNNIVAVEFDTYSNAWDPVLPHVGVDVNSINSIGYVEVAARHINKGFTAKASIIYYSTIKLLEVLVTVPDQKPPYSVTYKLAYVIDLRFLPEWVRIGFSGATGQLVETNNICSWSFRSSL